MYALHSSGEYFAVHETREDAIQDMIDVMIDWGDEFDIGITPCDTEFAEKIANATENGETVGISMLEEYGKRVTDEYGSTYRQWCIHLTEDEFSEYSSSAELDGYREEKYGSKEKALWVWMNQTLHRNMEGF